MGSDVENIGRVWGGLQDLRNLIQYGSAVGASIMLGDVGDEPLDWPNPGGVPSQG